jgi:tetratricopeptide (TPR) repeat protein
MRLLVQALEVSREQADRTSEQRRLANLGIACRCAASAAPEEEQQRQLAEQAVEHHSDALAICRETGDRRGEGRRLGNLGTACDQLGWKEQAIAHHSDALEISRELGDKKAEGRNLLNIGNVHFNHPAKDGELVASDAVRPGDYYRQALAVFQEAGDERGKESLRKVLTAASPRKNKPPQAAVPAAVPEECPAPEEAGAPAHTAAELEGMNMPLHAACEKGDLDSATALLTDQAVDPNSRNPAGVSPLVLAAGKGRAEVVALLLADARVDPNLCGRRGRGALHGACLKGHAEVVKLLLSDARVDVGVMDDEGRTPLSDATQKGHTQVLRAFAQWLDKTGFAAIAPEGLQPSPEPQPAPEPALAVAVEVEPEPEPVEAETSLLVSAREELRLHTVKLEKDALELIGLKHQREQLLSGSTEESKGSKAAVGEMYA